MTEDFSIMATHKGQRELQLKLTTNCHTEANTEPTYDNISDDDNIDTRIFSRYLNKNKYL